jgi:hypothetical protein
MPDWRPCLRRARHWSSARPYFSAVHWHALGSGTLTPETRHGEKREERKTYIDNGILQHNYPNSIAVHSALDCASPCGLVLRILELPAVSTFVKLQTRIVISLVQVLEHARKDLGLVVWQVDSLVRLVELSLAERREVGTVA